MRCFRDTASAGHFHQAARGVVPHSAPPLELGVLPLRGRLPEPLASTMACHALASAKASALAGWACHRVVQHQGAAAHRIRSTTTEGERTRRASC